MIASAAGALVLVMGAAGGCGPTSGSSSMPAPPDLPPTSATAVGSATAGLTVTGIVDGDTVTLSDGREARLLGIDSPEHGDCGFTEASQFARTTLLGKKVQVAADPTQARIDAYGRSLLYVVVDGRDYSTAIADTGWATQYVFADKPVRKAAAIAAAEAAARQARRGIWGGCATAPAPLARQPAPAAVDQTDDRARRVATPPQAAAAPAPAPRKQAEPTPAPRAGSGCHPSYTPCVPAGRGDLDCKDVGHRVSVIGPDEYRLDGADNDRKGCESYPSA